MKHDDEMSATLALLSDEDDLAFFDGLFEDLPDDVKVESPLLVTLSTRGHRRRLRWFATEDTAGIGSCDWRLVTQQQKHKRYIAEEENLKLRKLVQVHARETTKMIKLLQKATSLTATNHLVIHQPRCWMPYIGPAVDFHQIITNLDVLARTTDSVLAASSLATIQTNSFAVDHHIRTTPCGDTFEAIVEGTVLLPFDVEQITNAVANNSLKFVAKKGPSNVQTLCADANLQILQAVSRPKEKNGVQITKHGHFATRREPLRNDGSRLVLMDLSGGFVRNGTMVVTIVGNSYVLIRPVPGHDASTLGPLSCVRWYRQFTAQPNAANLNQIEQTKWIRDFTTSWNRKAQRQVDRGAQVLENLLLSCNE